LPAAHLPAVLAVQGGAGIVCIPVVSKGDEAKSGRVPAAAQGCAGKHWNLDFKAL
jgi:hypothetical protein